MKDSFSLTAFKGLARGFFAVAVALLAWEAVSRSGLVHVSLFPPPSHVLRALMEMAQSGELLRDFIASVGRGLLGLGLGASVGVSVGLLTGRIPGFDNLVSPLIQALRPLPPVATIPLWLVWFGIGDVSKIASIGFAVFFPVWLNTHLGARAIPETFIWSARTFNLSSFEIFKKIVFPGALPFIVAGFRTGVSLAFIMIFVSELAGASAGIGYQISVSHLAYRVDRMMAALAVLGIAGAMVDFLLARFIWFVFPWLKLTTEK